MIFQHTYQQIPTGQKTATRRPFGLGQTLKDGVLMSATGRKLHWVGQTISVQPGRAKKAVGQIRIKAMYAQKLHDMTEADAIKEGFCAGLKPVEGAPLLSRIVTALNAFFALWETMYEKIDFTETVVVYEFECLEWTPTANATTNQSQQENDPQ